MIRHIYVNYIIDSIFDFLLNHFGVLALFNKMAEFHQRNLCLNCMGT